MKFDYLKEVEAKPYPMDNVVREKRARSRIRKMEITPFGIITAQLAVCLAGSLIYLLYLLVVNANGFGLSQIFSQVAFGKAI